MQEPELLLKVRKYNHPNLPKLITWYRDPHGTIITIIEYRKGKTLLEYVEGYKKKKELISYDVIILIFS